jgi:hypothetical protein
MRDWSCQSYFTLQNDVHLVTFFTEKLYLFSCLNLLVSQELAQIIQIVLVQVLFIFGHILLKEWHFS